jgi:hypothetical protein
MSTVEHLIPGIQAFRPFLGSKDYETSLRFYKTLGFHAYPLGPTMAELSLGQHAFILHAHYVKEWAENMMMHVLVEDTRAWWRHIESLELTKHFDVGAPALKEEPWGLTITYVWDPAGVLWHFAEDTESYKKKG